MLAGSSPARPGARPGGGSSYKDYEGGGYDYRPA